MLKVIEPEISYLGAKNLADTFIKKYFKFLVKLLKSQEKNKITHDVAQDYLEHLYKIGDKVFDVKEKIEGRYTELKKLSLGIKFGSG